MPEGSVIFIQRRPLKPWRSAISRATPWELSYQGEGTVEQVFVAVEGKLCLVPPDHFHVEFSEP